jgi:flagellar motility protein MotE (MotC chaperone)
MCEKCDEIDKTIERYRGIKERVSDQALVARAKELIAAFEADKAALHPEIRLCAS